MSKKSKRIQDEVNQLLFDATEDLKRALRNHEHAHDANDLLPQFTKMCEKVKELESRQDLTRDHVKAMEVDITKLWVEIGTMGLRCDSLGKHIIDLEKSHDGICTQRATENWINALSSNGDTRDKRITELEEANAQLWENVGKLEIRCDNLSSELSQVSRDINAILIQHKHTEDDSRACSNAQAAEITRLMNRVRDQSDDVLELKKRVMAIEDKKKVGCPKKIK